MVYQLTWLPTVLEAAGLKVAEVDGWRTRGTADMGTVRGVMLHHTGTARRALNMPTLNLLIAGRAASAGAAALGGPLAQLGLGRDGTFYVIAAGRANHAGGGRWEGVETGNSSFIGIEAENDGAGEEWPDVQVDAYQRGVAALLRHLGAGANMCCGHKEYALPGGRKCDPDFDMSAFRAKVADWLAGKSPPPPIPAADAKANPTLRRGDSGDAVKRLQAALKLKADGAFGPGTEAAVRAFQRELHLVPDGIVGPRCWAALAAVPAQEAPAATAPAPAKAAAAAAPPPGLPAADDATHKIRVEGNTAFGPDGKIFAYNMKFHDRRGWGSKGETSLAAWLATRPALPPVSASTIRAVAAMCVAEGNLEAVNAYDDCHMSFGILQWTAGQADADGELPGLLTRLKAADPAAFQECFGRHGLDAAVGAAGITGHFILAGKPLRSVAEKDALRDPVWAYRFWRAGHHPAVRAAQFALAASRIGRFLTAPAAGKPLKAWVGSELGVALLLDEHVNRPNHVPKTLEGAIAALGLGGADPSGWTQADEHRLIDAYLARRATTNMTDSQKRALGIMAFAGRGELSAARGSFS